MTRTGDSVTPQEGLFLWKNYMFDSTSRKMITLGLLVVFTVGNTSSVDASWGRKIYTAEPKDFVQEVVTGLKTIQNSVTGLIPSHFDHPGYEDLGFLYDNAVDAIVYQASGHQLEAEKILDYFAKRISIATQEVQANKDSNGVYGIVKTLYQPKTPGKEVKAFVNAVNINATEFQGRGILEFSTTPGPQAFLIYAFLQVNPQKYYPYALQLGTTLLAMQDEDGGIRDGDRAPTRVHTEPHLDTMNAFLMLYQIDQDPKWVKAADKAWNWFKTNTYHPREGIVGQGVWEGVEQDIFATDAYSWTLAGPAGDRIPADVRKALTLHMLAKSLVRVTVPLPNGKNSVVVLTDFSDALDPLVQQVRKGVHPLGSIEWTGGVILALQKNAVRAWESGDSDDARLYKALAEELTKEVRKCFYPLDGKALYSFYASGQGIEIAPFGAINGDSIAGWKTPYYFVENFGGKDHEVRGSSSVAAWVVLPMLGKNPFILNDDYKLVYDTIPQEDRDLLAGQVVIDRSVGKKSYAEAIPRRGPEAAEQIVEPSMFNKRMWMAIRSAYSAQENKDFPAMRKHFREAIRWGNRVVEESSWEDLAKQENNLKKQEWGGLIAYPWGLQGGDEHAKHAAIWKYPLLNEMGAAMWGLTMANFELGNMKEAKSWMKKMIVEIPLHQIASVELDQQGSSVIVGYWNALDSWELNMNGTSGDHRLRDLYRQTLTEVRTAKNL